MNPSSSAAALLTAAVKRQGQLPKTLEFIVQVLNTSQDPREQDGALHMVGSLAPNLLKVCPFLSSMLVRSNPILSKYRVPIAQ
jgi:hypothetical protein